MECEALALPAPTPGWTILKKDNKKLSYMYCLGKQPDGKGL